jgi:CHASE2 domain-containing sensor protein
LSDPDSPKSTSQTAFSHVWAEVVKVGKIIQNRGILIIININLGLGGRRGEYPQKLDRKDIDPDLVSAAEREFWLLVMLLLSGICTIGTLILREQGVLQAQELSAFDYLMRLRPQERPDPRLLVVTVTESDIQGHKEGSLSDRTLSQLLSKLEEGQPRVIGLDLYRDFPVKAGWQELLPHFKNPKLIATCAGSTRGKKGISSPPGIPRERLGFSDVVVDDDGILRRHLLAMQPDLDSPCKTNETLSFQLALHYLAGQGIQPNLTEKEEYQIGKVIFTPLAVRRGGYRRLDTRGYQVFLNYRALQSPEQVAEQVTLSEVLSGRVDPRRLKDRVVLIGVSAESVKDDHLTPYSDRMQPPQRLSGVFVHAQMVSQVLSAVLDGRPMLWVWPDWAEMLWIVSWSVIGGVVGRVVRSRFQFVLAISALIVVLMATCWGGLLYGGWLPLVPSVLVVVITGGIVFVVHLHSPAIPLEDFRRVIGSRSD